MLTHGAFASCVVRDDVGESLMLSKPATRIVSLAPDITEILFAIGAGKQVVGVIGGTDYPKEVKRLPRVGSYAGLEMEKLFALHPDLIVTWGGLFQTSLAKLKKRGVAIYVANPHRLKDVATSMRHLGCLTGTTQIANVEADYYLELIRSAREQYASLKPVRVFYQIDSYALMTINKDSWINEAIETCGGVNVFKAARFIAPEVSMESVIGVAPEVILSDQENPRWKSRFTKWPVIPAVAHAQLYSVPADLVERAGPRLAKGVAAICQKLQWARQIRVEKIQNR